MIVFPNCKINLGLHILQQRKDGFHDLETVFFPVLLQDALEVVQHSMPVNYDIEITTSGLPIDADNKNNICVKAWQLLKKDFHQLPFIKMHLHKVIPSGAGLGGGSSDGAFTLLLLNKKFNLQLQQNQLINYALQLGSDCPFFIKNKACLATGRGENLEELELNIYHYKIVVVNPGISINTGWAFSKIKPVKARISLKEIIHTPITQWKDVLKNDFEEVVFLKFPEIKTIKEQFYQQGAVYASMSGSGSSVYGLFEKNHTSDFHFPAHYFIKTL